MYRYNYSQTDKMNVMIVSYKTSEMLGVSQVEMYNGSGFGGGGCTAGGVVGGGGVTVKLSVRWQGVTCHLALSNSHTIQ